MTKRGPTAGSPELARPRLQGLLVLARAAIAWERFWPALWPAPLVVAAFLVAALFELPSALDPWVHALALAAFALALGAILFRALRRFRVPARADAERRIERKSRLDHRPLSSFEDLPVADIDSGAMALWAEHRRRLLARLGRLRIGVPIAGFLSRDPYALRAAAGLLVVVAFVQAGGDAGYRLLNALVPGVGIGPVAGTSLELWIEPPAYTGAPPVYAQRDRPSLTFPAGSILRAHVNGGRGQPVLRVDGQATPFTTLDKSAFKVEATIAAGTRLTVDQGRDQLANWNLVVVPDLPPTIDLPRPPAKTQRMALRLDYEARDDYGLASIGAGMRLIGEDGAPKGDEVVEQALPLPAGYPPQARGTTYHDLTAHKWAGLEVELMLTATDGAGQTGHSPSLRLTLPERAFTHPVAQAIIAERKRLSLTPEKRPEIATALGEISALPEDYDEDLSVFLALSVAKWRLRHDENEQALDEVRDLLWDTALHVEDGNLSMAERELRAAQRALMEALARNAPDHEIERLMERMRQAMDRFLQSLTQQAEEAPDPAERNLQSIQSQDLQRMLDQIREMARSGNRDAARQMLAQLQNILENLRRARMAGQQGQMNAEMMKMLRELQEMAQQQRGLLDRTFRNARQRDGQQQGQQGQRGQQGQQGQRGQQGQEGDGGEMGELSAGQEGLRRALGEFMRRLGEQRGQIPGGLGRAERAMRDAIGALDQTVPGEALGPQTEALDQLQQAGQGMARELARQMGMDGVPQGDTDEMPPPGMDPLGRPMGGYGMDTSDVQVPDSSDVQRARGIRDELRNRSGDRLRPQFELDYIERLLRRF